MLVVNRYRVAAPSLDGFLEQARGALAALAARPGYLGGQVARSTDEDDLWLLLTRWEGVGAYRRALGGYDVKVATGTLMHSQVDEPGAYEVLVDHPAGADPTQSTSDRAPAAASRRRTER